jgi:hypothetical protein
MSKAGHHKRAFRQCLLMAATSQSEVHLGRRKPVIQGGLSSDIQN